MSDLISQTDTFFQVRVRVRVKLKKKTGHTF